MARKVPIIFTEAENALVDEIIKGLIPNTFGYHETEDPVYLKKILLHAHAVERAKKTAPGYYRRNKVMTRPDMLLLLKERMKYSRLDMGSALAFLLSFAYCPPRGGEAPNFNEIEKINALFRKKPTDSVPARYAMVQDHVENHIEIALINRLTIKRPLNNPYDIIRPNDSNEQRTIDIYMKMIAGETRYAEALVDRLFLNLDQLQQSPDFTGHLPPSESHTIALRAFYTLYFYAPIAERLGRYTLKTALLDEVVRIIDPQEFVNLTAFREKHQKAGPMLKALEKGMKLAAEKTVYANYYEVESDMKSVSSIYFKMKGRLHKKESSLARKREELQILQGQLADLEENWTIGRESDKNKRKRELTRELAETEKDIERESEELEQYRKDLKANGNNPLAHALLEKYLPDFWRARGEFKSKKYIEVNKITLSRDPQKQEEEIRDLENTAISAIVQAIKDSRLFILNEKEEAPYIRKKRKKNGYEAWHLVGLPSAKLISIMIRDADTAAEKEAFQKISRTAASKMQHEIQNAGEAGQQNNLYGTASRASYKYGQSLADMFTNTKTIAVRTEGDEFYEIPENANPIHMAAAVDPELAATLGLTVYCGNEAHGVERREMSIEETLQNGDRVELRPWPSDLYLRDAGHRQTILDALRGTEAHAAVRGFYDKKRLSYELR
jgi:hypothetical protein